MEGKKEGVRVMNIFSIDWKTENRMESSITHLFEMMRSSAISNLPPTVQSHKILVKLGV